jgi:hypothetical protein
MVCLAYHGCHHSHNNDNGDDDAAMSDSVGLVASNAIIASFSSSSRGDVDRIRLDTARVHLLSHRWTSVRDSSPPSFRDLISRWWRCILSMSSLSARGGPHWDSLRVEDDGLQSQQCEASIVPHSTGMIAETTGALRDLLRRLHVDGIDDKRCVVLKLIRSPPGAARQRLHYDVPTLLPLRDKHRRAIPGTTKAAHCVSVLVHLNPGSSAGTHLPRRSHVDMLRMIAGGETFGSLACDASMYVSSRMDQSDVTVFYDDVPHYGPAHPMQATNVECRSADVSMWRWVLFAMFSPERGARQDEQQTFLVCEEGAQR